MAKATTSPRKVLRLIRQNTSFSRKLKKVLKLFSKDQAKRGDQENLIPEIDGKAKNIKADKLPKSHWFINKVSG